MCVRQPEQNDIFVTFNNKVQSLPNPNDTESSETVKH